MEFQDYYKTLEVDRKASQDEIHKSFRKLARKCHPDVNKAKGAEEKFKQLNEAYEVLKDPEKRSKYDLLGANWKAGEKFRPPPEWSRQGESFGFGGGGPGSGFSFEGGGEGFSDFFEALFGRAGSPFSGVGVGGTEGRQFFGEDDLKGRSHLAELPLSIEDLIQGGKKTITLASHTRGSTGKTERQQKTYQVSIPPGTTNGSTIRLAGQGEASPGSGKAGDLLLKVKVVAHARFSLQGADLTVPLNVSPWEAALGAKVDLALPDGQSVRLSIPEGAQYGMKLRVRGKGLPLKDGARGDVFAVLKVVVPEHSTEKERSLWEQLQKVSEFEPRAVGSERF